MNNKNNSVHRKLSIIYFKTTLGNIWVAALKITYVSPSVHSNNYFKLRYVRLNHSSVEFMTYTCCGET